MEEDLQIYSYLSGTITLSELTEDFPHAVLRRSRDVYQRLIDNKSALAVWCESNDLQPDTVRDKLNALIDEYSQIKVA